MSQPTYFHLTSALLEPGSVILPGNWGRMLRFHPPDEMMYREHILELVRQTQFPDKPSRLNAVFVLEMIETAMNFRNETKRIIDLIYEVEFVHPDARFHRGDWMKVGGPGPWLDHLQKAAFEYWQGQNIENAEIVTDSPLRIIRLVP